MRARDIRKGGEYAYGTQRDGVEGRCKVLELNRPALKGDTLVKIRVCKDDGTPTMTRVQGYRLTDAPVPDIRELEARELLHTWTEELAIRSERREHNRKIRRQLQDHQTWKDNAEARLKSLGYQVQIDHRARRVTVVGRVDCQRLIEDLEELQRHRATDAAYVAGSRGN